YPITLIATNECGRDTLTDVVTVHPPDVQAFISLDTIAGCQPWRFQPQSFSTPGANLAWEVLAPDGNIFASGNDASPDFELTQAGLHRVILRAARCGEDADTVFVDVLPAPEVSFTMDPAICRGDSLMLTNTSPSLAGGFYSLGNGDSTEQLNTTVVYEQPGNYQVSFTGFSAFNNCPATTTLPVVVNDLPMIAIAATDTAGCAPFTTTFTNTETTVGPLNYVWDFTDGTNPASTPSPSHTFSTAGNYFPTLRVTDAIGCSSDTFFTRITVHPDPIPSFTVDNARRCARYDSLTLTNTSIDAIVSDWTIDGQTFGGLAPRLPLTTPGQIPITLQVTNAFGCSANTEQTVEVLPSPNAQIASTPNALCLRERLELASLTTDASDLLWDLGDNTGQIATSFTHVYAAPGDYVITLVATQDNGCPADTTDIPITVHPLPEADYTLSAAVRCGTPAPVNFSNASSGAIAYFWAFGDGETATTLNPVHTYTQFGVYAPTLIAETSFGCRDTVSQALTISGNPVAEFIRPPARACAPYQLSIAAEPTEAIRYEWYLDDAFAPIVGEQLDTLLTEDKVYDLRLIAIYDDLCRDTIDVGSVLTLENRPVAGFTHEVDGSPNLLGDVFFQSTSTGGSDLFWDLGDGTQQFVSSFFHEYRINRDITVTHAVTERYEQGLVCSDTIRRDIAPEWITTFFVPNAISPEAGPAEVRTWGAKGFGVAHYDLEVFSATGKIIFRTSDLADSQPSGRWDGTHPDTGALILQGVYSWRAVVEYVDGNRDELKGTVTVIR
ncbi:MAG: PKD domain-containing protein, partial [Bacteroidota bacterium]